MKYIIMCGGSYKGADRHLYKIKGECIVARTIRLLKENGVEDIAISTNNPGYEEFGVPILHHENRYGAGGMWIEAFYPSTAPTCYIFGDVVFSEEAIKTIVETKTDSIEYFASAPPFDPRFIKKWAEPYALKVQNIKLFRIKLKLCRQLAEAGAFKRGPIMWELWQVIKGTPINTIDYGNYCVINDWTCDVDSEDDYNKICEVLK